MSTKKKADKKAAKPVAPAILIDRAAYEAAVKSGVDPQEAERLARVKPA